MLSKNVLSIPVSSVWMLFFIHTHQHLILKHFSNLTSKKCYFLFWSFFKLYFIDYAITVSWFFHFCPPSTNTPYTLRQSSHHCSCPWVMCVSSLAAPFPILYFTSPWLFCNYLFVLLNPLTSSPVSYTHLTLPTRGSKCRSRWSPYH